VLYAPKHLRGIELEPVLRIPVEKGWRFFKQKRCPFFLGVVKLLKCPEVPAQEISATIGHVGPRMCRNGGSAEQSGISLHGLSA
jgi:hypothetical protein